MASISLKFNVVDTICILIWNQMSIQRYNFINRNISFSSCSEVQETNKNINEENAINNMFFMSIDSFFNLS